MREQGVGQHPDLSRDSARRQGVHPARTNRRKTGSAGALGQARTALRRLRAISSISSKLPWNRNRRWTPVRATLRLRRRT